MEVGAGIWYIARLALLALSVVIAIIVAVLQARRRRFASPVRATAACVLAVAAALLGAFSALRPNPLWIAGALVAGIALGIVLGRLSDPSVRGGRPAVKRWPVGQLFAATGYVAFSAMVLFGTPMLAALALVAAVMGLAMVAGAQVGESTVAPKLDTAVGARTPVPPA